MSQHGDIFHRKDAKVAKDIAFFEWAPPTGMPSLDRNRLPTTMPYLPGLMVIEVLAG